MTEGASPETAQRAHGYANNDLWDKLAEIDCAVKPDPEKTPEGKRKDLFLWLSLPTNII